MSVYELIVNKSAFGIAESVVGRPSGLGERQIHVFKWIILL